MTLIFDTHKEDLDREAALMTVRQEPSEKGTRFLQRYQRILTQCGKNFKIEEGEFIDLCVRMTPHYREWLKNLPQSHRKIKFAIATIEAKEAELEVQLSGVAGSNIAQTQSNPVQSPQIQQPQTPTTVPLWPVVPPILSAPPQVCTFCKKPDCSPAECKVMATLIKGAVKGNMDKKNFNREIVCRACGRQGHIAKIAENGPE